MVVKKVFIVIATFVLLAGSIAASQEYRVVKVWPEVPQGWHFYQPVWVTVPETVDSPDQAALQLTRQAT